MVISLYVYQEHYCVQYLQLKLYLIFDHFSKICFGLCCISCYALMQCVFKFDIWGWDDFIFIYACTLIKYAFSWKPIHPRYSPIRFNSYASSVCFVLLVVTHGRLRCADFPNSSCIVARCHKHIRHLVFFAFQTGFSSRAFSYKIVSSRKAIHHRRKCFIKWIGEILLICPRRKNRKFSVKLSVLKTHCCASSKECPRRFWWFIGRVIVLGECSFCFICTRFRFVLRNLMQSNFYLVNVLSCCTSHRGKTHSGCCCCVRGMGEGVCCCLGANTSPNPPFVCCDVFVLAFIQWANHHLSKVV